MGATSWVYINDKNLGNVSPQGLYWTTETITDDMFDMNTNYKKETKDGETYYTQRMQTYSNQDLLSYYYDPSTKTYSVIKNPVWMNQADLNGSVALSAKKDWEKPAAKGIGEPVSSFAEAQKIYEAEKARNGGSAIYQNAHKDEVLPEGAVIK